MLNMTLKVHHNLLGFPSRTYFCDKLPSTFHDFFGARLAISISKICIKQKICQIIPGNFCRDLCIKID